MSNDDMPARDRIEKLEEVVATTRAQLEKAFVVITVLLLYSPFLAANELNHDSWVSNFQEIRNLRALLASENKLRELHVNKLRDEVELLKSYVYRSMGQRSPNF